MSTPTSDQESPTSAEAGLDLRRHTVRGFTAGCLLAAAVFVRFALLPGTDRPLGLYIGLAVVLGVSIGLLVTAVSVAWRVRQLARGR